MASFANYAYWYPLLKDHCPKSIILDSACIQAMLRHCTGSGTVGIRLSTHAPLYSPQSSESEHESETETRCTADTVNRPGHESDSESENESDHDKFEVSQAESYPGELEAIALIEATIQSLGGSVFIKDNMHAPNDAGWIAPCQSLACFGYNDVFTLLSASDKMTASRFPLSCSPRSLVCKKWIPSLDTTHEYRLEIKNNSLVTLLPRLSMSHVSRSVVDRMKRFVQQEICPKLDIHSYLLDIYDDPRTGRILVLDLSDEAIGVNEASDARPWPNHASSHPVALPLELKEASLTETIEKLALQRNASLS